MSDFDELLAKAKELGNEIHLPGPLIFKIPLFPPPHMTGRYKNNSRLCSQSYKVSPSSEFISCTRNLFLPAINMNGLLNQRQGIRNMQIFVSEVSVMKHFLALRHLLISFNIDIWHDGKPNPKGGRNVEPNNWVSLFYGSAWTWSEIRKQYYFHQFAKQQPDLNYRNRKVMEHMSDVL